MFDRPEQNACAALLACVSLLWCTEALPLFVTSMLVPLLVVLLRVLVDRSDPQHPQRMSPKEAAPHIFHAMFSQVGASAHPCGAVQALLGVPVRSEGAWTPLLQVFHAGVMHAVSSFVAGLVCHCMTVHAK